jgi:excisionase family DNA binding protein
MATQSSAWTGEKPREAGNGAGRGSATRIGEKVVPISPASCVRDILTKAAAAEYIGCSSRYLERQIRAGRLKALKPTGKLVRIRLSDLTAFLESGSTIGEDL